MSIDTSIAHIRSVAAEKRITPTRLARLARLHANTLRGFNSPDWNPTRKTLTALENVVKGLEEHVLDSHCTHISPCDQETIHANQTQNKATVA